MPTFTIRVINSNFRADVQHELDDLKAARKEALKGALQIGAEEVVRGQPFFGAEVSVDQDDKPAARFLVSVGTSPLS